MVKGLALDSDALTRLGKQFKAACGSGGTVKDGVIEIRGDHRERVIEALGKQGWVVKRTGMTTIIFSTRSRAVRSR